MEATSKTYRFVRVIYAWIWFGFHCLLLAILVFTASMGAKEVHWLLLLLSVGMTSVIYGGFYSFPVVQLSEKGVKVRVLVREQFYEWREIVQAGILYRQGRGIGRNHFILVKPNGSSRRYKDKTFWLRNFGKLICFSATQQTREYVVKHYGPLDFDLAYGKTE